MNKAEALQVYIEGFLKQKAEQHFKEIIEYHMENHTEIVEEFVKALRIYVKIPETIQKNGLPFIAFRFR